MTYVTGSLACSQTELCRCARLGAPASAREVRLAHRSLRASVALTVQSRRGIVLGLALGLGARALLRQILLLRFRRDLARLNGGDYRPLLSMYADDAVLRFNDGPHLMGGRAPRQAVPSSASCRTSSRRGCAAS